MLKIKNYKTKVTYTVIEFSGQRVKLAQCSLRHKIVHKFIQEAQSESDTDLTDALSKIIKTNRIKIDNLIISLERSYVTIRLIKLPSINEQEIREMSEWQAAKLLPYKIDEIVVDSQIVKTDEEGFSYVLLIVAPKNIIKKFIDICESLKLNPQAITISSEGLLGWYLDKNPQRNLEETFALLNCDKERFELVIIFQDKFIFSRSFSFAQVQDKNELKDKIASEVKLSFDSYVKQEVSPAIKNIVLAGSQDTADLPAVFKKEFDLPVEVITEDGSFSSVCATALTQTLPKINLMPQELKEGVLFLKKKKELIKTIFLAGLGFLVISGIFGFNLYSKKKILNILDQKLSEINPQAKQIQEIKNKISLINSQTSEEDSCIEILSQVHRITPKDIFLQSFIFEEGKNITLKGTAPAMSSVFGFVPVLNESGLFKNVQVRYTTQRKTQTQELFDFEIVCELSSVAK